jgi:peroxiredoxin
MRSILVLWMVIGLAAQAAAGEELAFSLSATDATAVSVAVGEAEATAVIFLGTECPMARLYGPRLSRLAREFSDRGVQVVGVNSNRQDSIADIERYVREHSVTFPIVRDKGNVIADRYGATRTPEVFLLDRDLNVRYHGRIDDQYAPGVSRSAPQREDLRVAIEQLLAGNEISVPRTEPLGCFIGKVPRPDGEAVVRNEITFTEHVSRVLQMHCIECHRDGEIAPFAMEQYDEVVGWASTMLETIEDGRMPPWSADPVSGKFANARHMPEADKQIFRDWVAGGMKRGDPEKLPEAIEYLSGWQLPREPDVILPMRDRAYRVPAEGTVEYQYFVVDPGFEEDKWILGAQIIPGARSVVHHAIAFLRPPDGVPMRGIGWLTAYVPGQRLVPLPPGHARKVPAGSKIVFQMHYTTNGREQDDLSSVGIVFVDPDEVTHRVITLIGIEQEFEIPPHTEAHNVTAAVGWLPESGTLLGVAPHMHYRGKSFELYADRGDKTQTLLRVPRYDFNWQHSYAFAEPIALDGIDRLHFRATFDNSKDNPFNPDPSEWVTWGDQTWEEMAVAFFEVAEPIERSTTSKVESQPTPADEAERQRKIEAYVSRVFEKLDADGDGEITESELSIVVRHWNLGDFDRNGDKVITRDEVRELAESLY